MHHSAARPAGGSARASGPRCFPCGPGVSRDGRLRCRSGWRWHRAGWGTSLAGSRPGPRISRGRCTSAGSRCVPIKVPGHIRHGDVHSTACSRTSDANAAWRGRIPSPVAWRLHMGAPYELEQTTFAWSLARALRREPADILHVQDPVVALRLDQLRRLGMLRTRTILAHGTEEPGTFLQRLRYVQHLAPTHLERCRAAGVWRPTWTAFGNFVDVERFRPGSAPDVRAELGIAPDAKVLLTLAAIKRPQADRLACRGGRALSRAASRDATGPGRCRRSRSGHGRRDSRGHGSPWRQREVSGPSPARTNPRSLPRRRCVLSSRRLFEMMPPIALLASAAQRLPCTHAHRSDAGNG